MPNNPLFTNITKLTQDQEGMVQSLLAGIILQQERADPIRAVSLLDQSLGVWETLGAGGKIVIAEAASLFASIGMVGLGERIVHRTQVKPLRLQALLPMAQSILGAKFYAGDGCSIVEMLTHMEGKPTLGAGGRAGVLKRLVASPVEWEIGIDAFRGKPRDLTESSCARAIAAYWDDRGPGWGKKEVERVSMQETIDFAKALVDNGSDPLGGSVSALARAIPSAYVMGKFPDMWMVEQIIKLGWVDDRAREQAWSTAVHEDVARIYRKNQKMGGRVAALERLGIDFGTLSETAPRRLSLKMSALDTACVPIIEKIKAKGLDVKWRGPTSMAPSGFFGGVGVHSQDALERTLEAAKDLDMSFTAQDLVRQCAAAKPAAIAFMLARDPSLVDDAGDQHPLAQVTAYSANEKNRENIAAMLRIFSEVARKNGQPIGVDPKMLTVLMRSGSIETVVEKLDCFWFDPEKSTPLFNKMCSHGVEWDAKQGQSMARLARHLVDGGVELPKGKKRQSGLVIKAMQNRNPQLAITLMDMGVDVQGISIEEFIPKAIKKSDAANVDAMAQALLALARGGVVMANVGGSVGPWINPLIAAAQQAWMDESVAQAQGSPTQARAARPRF